MQFFRVPHRKIPEYDTCRHVLTCYFRVNLKFVSRVLIILTAGLMSYFNDVSTGLQRLYSVEWEDIMNGELGETWKEAAVAFLKMLAWRA